MRAITRTVAAAAAVVLLAGATVAVVPQAAEAAAAPARAAVSAKSSPTATTVEVTVKKVKRATGYRIEVAKSKKFKKAKAKTSEKNVLTASKLSAGTRYYVRARAYKVSGGKKVWGRWSKVATVTTRPAAAKVASKSSTASSVTVRWKAVKGATKYQIRWSANSSMSGASTASLGKSARSKAVTGLPGDAVRYLQVRAGNASGWGAWSSAASVKTAHAHSWVYHATSVEVRPVYSDVFKCTVCESEFGSYSEWRDHDPGHTANGNEYAVNQVQAGTEEVEVDSPYSSCSCGARMDLSGHTHTWTYVAEVPGVTKKVGTVYECYCGEQFLTEEDFTNHSKPYKLGGVSGHGGYSVVPIYETVGGSPAYYKCSCGATKGA